MVRKTVAVSVATVLVVAAGLTVVLEHLDAWPMLEVMRWAALPGDAHAQVARAVLGLIATDQITDDHSLVLDGAAAIATFQTGGRTYAAVVSATDDGVQILDVTNPASIVATGYITDDFRRLVLNGPNDITIFRIDGYIYAAVLGHTDRGLQILNITDPADIVATSQITDDDSLMLDNAFAITTFRMDGSTYAAIASFDGGAQILNMTDLANIVATSQITDDDSLMLDGAFAITTFRMGGSTYAAVTAWRDNGVQILNVTDPANIVATSQITDDRDLALKSASGIDIFQVGGSTYAAVASFDDGAQILNVTDPANIVATSQIHDDGDLALDWADGIDIFQVGGSTYAAVAAQLDHGIQILNVTDPANIAAVGQITDDDNLELNRAIDVDTFQIDGYIYAAVASYGDDGVQILQLAESSDNLAAVPGAPQNLRATPTHDSVILAWDPPDDDSITGYKVLSPDTTDPSRLSVHVARTNGTGASYTVTGLQPSTAYVFGVAAVNEHGESGPSEPVSVSTAAPARTHFVTTWRTSSANESITIPVGGATGTYTVDWGDGTVSANVTGDQTHAYGTPGTHTVRIYGDFTRMHLDGQQPNADKLRSIEQWGDIRWESMSSAFRGTSSMAYNATDAPDLSAVSSMYRMFGDAYSFDGDLSSWNTSTVTNMSGMFDGAASFNQDISGWDVSAVTNMSGMFDGAYSFEQNLGPWYIVLDTDSPAVSADDRLAGNIGAQNAHLSGHNPTYNVTGEHAGLFEVVGGALRLKDGQNVTTTTYQMTVAATGDGLFGSGNRLVVPVAATGPGVNAPPTVQAGPDQTVAEGSTVHLNATATDDDTDALAYLWTHDRPALDITLANATSPSTTFTAPQVASNTTIAFTLTVHDGTASASDSLNVTVTHANAPPTVQAGPDQTVAEGSTVHLNATATDDDTDALAYLWTHDRPALDITLANATSPSTTFTAPQVASNTTIAFTLTVHDGTASASDSLNVTVTYVNTTTVWTPDQPPGLYGIGRISLASEAPGTIQATWEEPDRDPVRYRMSWAKVGEPYRTWSDQSGNAFPTEPTHTITGLEGGQTYKVAVRADYNGSAGPWSGDAVVVVAKSANNPPTVDAGADRTVTGGQNATLTGTATDPDGDDLAYLWTHDRPDLDITLANATSPSTTFTAPKVSANTTLTFTLTATDTHNATASDSTDVTIAEAPEDPPAAPVQNITAVLEAPVPRDSRDIGRITLTSSAPGTILAAWEAPAENPANYRIAWAKEGEPFRTWTDRSGNAYPVEPAHTMTGLEEGAEYRVMVRASYAGTAGDWSGELAITVASASPPAVPGAPQNLRATPAHDSVVLAWDRPDDDSITGYKILSGSAADPSRLSALVNNTNSTDTTYTVEGLQPSTAYVFGVAAVNEHGESGPSEPVGVSTAVPAHTHFVTTWRTSSANESIMIPVGGATGTYTVDWGDGTVSANVTGNQRHAYGTPGTHTVRIYGDFTRIHLNEQQPNAGKLRSIEQWGDIRWESMNSAFQGASNMVYRAADAPDLSGVTDTSWMFYGATSFNGNISSWDVSAVTNMYKMLHAATSFNQDLSSWDVSAVTNMAHMFSLATSFNGDISTWNTSAVTDMHGTFSQATSFNQDLSSWDVSSVTDMHSMFPFATSFNGNISTWDVSAANDMRNMFSHATSFNQDLSSWDVSAVTEMSQMFRNATSFNQDLSSWDVSSVTGMNRMFWDATSFNQDVSGWDVAGVTNMRLMFWDATSFNQDVSGWDVAGVTDMRQMFYGADSFEQNLGPWYVVLDTDSPAVSADDRLAGNIGAQNAHLSGHNPIYNVTGEHAGLFEVAGGALRLKDNQNVTTTTYQVTVAATGDGLFGSGNHLVIPVAAAGQDANAPPAVQAGPDRTIPEGDTVTLTGTATDPDGDHLTYLWTHDSTLEIAFANSTAPSTTFAAPQVASNTTITFTLTATDAHNATASDRVEITIAQVNAPPAVQAGPDRTIPEGDTVTLTGTATDPDGDHLTYLWTHDSTLEIAFANSTAPSTTFAAPQVASNTTITFTLTATDAHNATASDRVEITIAQVNAPPTVQAGPDRTIPEGDTVTLTGTATDPDGDHLTYLWTHDQPALDIILDNATSVSTTFAAPQVASNTTVTFTLTADDGTDTSSDTLALTIADAPFVPSTLQPSAFVTTWRTSAANESITIPVGGAAGTYTVDWGDGTVSTDVTGDQTHTYDAAGAYTVSISGDFARIHLNGDANAAKLRSIDQWGDTQWESMEFAFKGASSMVYRATDSPDLTGVTSIRHMFHGASSFNGDISSWDVSSVTNMIGAFREAASFNQDISSWDVSAANDMRSMFREAASFNQDISSWDVSTVVAMTGMFHGASSFNQDISSWDVSSATDTRSMFRGASSFNQDISSWDVSSVTTMVSMFREAASFNQDLSSWDVSGVTSTAGMFRGASSFNQDLSSWDVSSATDMGDMFRQADSFAQNLGRWYIALGDTTISSANETLAISAQNAYLDGQNPTYSVADARFAVAGGALAVNPDQTPQPGSYNVTISSAGGFGTDNARVVEITVDLEPTIRSTETVAPTVNHTGQDVPANRPPTADAGPDRTVNEGSTVVLNGTAADPDGDTLTYLWTSEQPGLSISGNDTLSASFTAPQVASNTTITFTLTVSDGTNAAVTDQVRVSVTDQVRVSVTEVPQPGSPPDAPQNLQATSTNTDITLTWNPANDDSITGYKILSRTPYTQTELSVLVDDTGSADTSYLVRNLDPDTVYVFRVIAINEHGESGWSNFVRLSTLP